MNAARKFRDLTPRSSARAEVRLVEIEEPAAPPQRATKAKGKGRRYKCKPYKRPAVVAPVELPKDCAEWKDLPGALQRAVRRTLMNQAELLAREAKRQIRFATVHGRGDPDLRDTRELATAYLYAAQQLERDARDDPDAVR